MRVRLESYEIEAVVDTGTIQPYDTKSEEYREHWNPENGLPHLGLENVRREQRGGKWEVSGRLAQAGRTSFRIPVVVVLKSEKGKSEHTVWLANSHSEFEIESSVKPLELRVDPGHDLLKLQRMPQRLQKLWMAHPESVTVIYGTVSEESANRGTAKWFHEYVGWAAERVKPDTAMTTRDLETEVVVLIDRPSTRRACV